MISITATPKTTHPAAASGMVNVFTVSADALACCSVHEPEEGIASIADHHRSGGDHQEEGRCRDQVRDRSSRNDIRGDDNGDEPGALCGLDEACQDEWDDGKWDHYSKEVSDICRERTGRDHPSEGTGATEIKDDHTCMLCPLTKPPLYTDFSQSGAPQLPLPQGEQPEGSRLHPPRVS